MDKEVAGQPLWLWAVGAAVVIGGFLYFRSHGSSAASSSGQPASGGSKSKDTSSFKETITNLQGPPAPGHKKKKKKG